MTADPCIMSRLLHPPTRIRIRTGFVGGQGKLKGETVVLDETVHRVHRRDPLGVVVVAREYAAGLHLRPPLFDRLAALLTGVGVAVDVDEIEGLIGEVGQGLLESHPQEQRATVARRREALGGLDIFGRIVVVGPAVDPPEAEDAVVAEDEFGKAPLGYPQLDAFTVEERGGEGLTVGVDGGGLGNGGGPEAGKEEREAVKLAHRVSVYRNASGHSNVI